MQGRGASAVSADGARLAGGVRVYWRVSPSIVALDRAWRRADASCLRVDEASTSAWSRACCFAVVGETAVALCYQTQGARCPQGRSEKYKKEGDRALPPKPPRVEGAPRITRDIPNAAEVGVNGARSRRDSRVRVSVGWGGVEIDQHRPMVASARAGRSAARASSASLAGGQGGRISETQG